jgi:NAD(P)-dependent dehydrogenase (short-subunit alcohol dehydrogenase family)
VFSRGAKGIGLETTVYLASKGATVYVAARKSEGTHAGIEEARRRVTTATSGGAGQSDSNEKIKHHELDLSSMQAAWQSAQAFKRLEQKLDILICNAGVSMTTLQKLSPDGYETMFAVNHLGHFAFVTALLGWFTLSIDCVAVRFMLTIMRRCYQEHGRYYSRWPYHLHHIRRLQTGQQA